MHRSRLHLLLSKVEDLEDFDVAFDYPFEKSSRAERFRLKLAMLRIDAQGVWVCSELPRSTHSMEWEQVTAAHDAMQWQVLGLFRYFGTRYRRKHCADPLINVHANAEACVGTGTCLRVWMLLLLFRRITSIVPGNPDEASHIDDRADDDDQDDDAAGGGGDEDDGDDGDDGDEGDGNGIPPQAGSQGGSQGGSVLKMISSMLPWAGRSGH